MSHLLSACAHLDASDFWPTSYAVTKLTAADQEQLVALLKQAVGLVEFPSMSVTWSVCPVA